MKNPSDPNARTLAGPPEMLQADAHARDAQAQGVHGDGMGSGPARIDPYLGRTIDGRYLIEQVLGEGGMGVVWDAVDERTGERRALKFLRADKESDGSNEARLLREAQQGNLGVGHKIRFPARKLEQHNRKGIEVGAGSHFGASQLLRGQIADLSAHDAGSRSLALETRARNTKVDQYGFALAIDKLGDQPELIEGLVNSILGGILDAALREQGRYQEGSIPAT